MIDRDPQTLRLCGEEGELDVSYKLLASFPGSPMQLRRGREPGTFYHGRDVQGRHEIDTTLLCMGTYGIPPTSFELAIDINGTKTAAINCKVDWCSRFSVSDMAPDGLNGKKSTTVEPPLTDILYRPLSEHSTRLTLP